MTASRSAACGLAVEEAQRDSGSVAHAGEDDPLRSLLLGVGDCGLHLGDLDRPVAVAIIGGCWGAGVVDVCDGQAVDAVIVQRRGHPQHLRRVAAFAVDEDGPRRRRPGDDPRLVWGPLGVDGHGGVLQAELIRVGPDISVHPSRESAVGDVAHEVDDRPGDGCALGRGGWSGDDQVSPTLIPTVALAYLSGEAYFSSSVMVTVPSCRRRGASAR